MSNYHVNNVRWTQGGSRGHGACLQECPWVEHLTSLQIVGWASVSKKGCPCHVHSNSKPIIGKTRGATSSFKVKS